MRTTYYSVGSRVIGVVGVLFFLVVGVVGGLPSGHFAAWGVALCVFLAAACWVSLVRPSMTVESDEVLLRQMVEDVRIPLRSIRDFSVRQIGRIHLVDDRTFTTAAVSRNRNQLQRDAGGRVGIFNFDLLGSRLDTRLGAKRTDAEARSRSYGWHVEQTMENRLQALRDAQDATGTGPGVAADVVRRRAWPEIVVLVASAVVTVVLLFV